MDEDLMLAVKVTGLIIAAIVVIGILLATPCAYYQSKVTGYSFAECFWAGDSIKTINLHRDSK